MTKDEYLSTQMQLVAMKELLIGMNLKEFVEAISHAHTVGPILDPTLYRKAIYDNGLEDITVIANALLTAQRVIQGQINKRIKQRTDP